MKITILYLLLAAINLSAQYPFEKYPVVKYEEYNNWKIYDRLEKEKKVHQTLTVQNFFGNDSLTIQLTNVAHDSSFIRIYRNLGQTQKFYEQMYLAPENMTFPLRVADFDGDGRKDLKVMAYSMGNGLASLNIRVIYLFQVEVGRFIKVSYFDVVGPNIDERDFDGDGKYEIMTRTLIGYSGHSYWAYNLYSFVYNWQIGQIENVNERFGYPIMIQFLERPNYAPTDKIPKRDRGMFTIEKPEELDIRN